MAKEGPIYFWKPTYAEPEWGFFSQWEATPFVVDGQTYATAEMWMMMGKARLFGDAASEAAMKRTSDPRKHQGIGRKVAGYDGQVWDQNKSRVVEEGSWHKFNSDAALRKKLLDTGDRLLVEASPFDRVWGIGFTAENAKANKDKWGQNLLGRALMAVRERLRAEDEAASGPLSNTTASVE